MEILDFDITCDEMPNEIDAGVSNDVLPLSGSAKLLEHSSGVSNAITDPSTKLCSVYDRNNKSNKSNIKPSKIKSTCGRYCGCVEWNMDCDIHLISDLILHIPEKNLCKMIEDYYFSISPSQLVVIKKTLLDLNIKYDPFHWVNQYMTSWEIGIYLFNLRNSNALMCNYNQANNNRFDNSVENMLREFFVKDYLQRTRLERRFIDTPFRFDI